MENKSHFSETQSVFYEVRFPEKNGIVSIVASLDKQLTKQMPTNSNQLSYSIYIKRNSQWLAHFVPLTNAYWDFPISNLERLQRIIEVKKVVIAPDGKFNAVEK